MDKKGFWALLVSVSKAWKTLFTRTRDSFRYRIAAGDDNILLPEKNGRAVIDTIYGNTVKYNQISPLFSVTSGDVYWAIENCTTEVVENGKQVNVTFTSATNLRFRLYNAFTTHKYYFKWQSKIDANCPTTWVGSDFPAIISADDTVGAWSQKSQIITGSVLSYGVAYPSGTVEGATFSIRNFMITDLTLIFDAGNEPSTPEEFEQWLALNVGTQDYYPYDEGSLISFCGTKGDWPQKITNGDFSDGVTGWTGTDLTISADNGRCKAVVNTVDYLNPWRDALSTTLNAINNHKYYIAGIVDPPKPGFIRIYHRGDPPQQIIRQCGPNKKSFSGILIGAEASPATLYIALYGNERQHYDVGDILYFDNIQVVDLTELYGTDEQIAAALNITVADINGSAANFDGGRIAAAAFKQMTPPSYAIRSVGFNQWDEECEVGSISIYTGGNEPANNRIRTKNYISISANKQYFFERPSNYDAYIFFYDSNKDYLNYERLVNLSNPFTPVTNSAYIRFYMESNYGTTYNHDICINLSDPVKNGTYEPYWEDVLPIDATKVYGKVNGAGEYVQCYPNGMLSAGSVYDEINAVNGEAVKRVGSVNLRSVRVKMLGSQSHTITTYYANFTTAYNAAVTNVNLKSNRYVAGAVTNDNSPNYNIQVDSSGSLLFRDDSLSASDINQYGYIPSLDGIMLYFELATPITYTDLIYSEDGGVTGTPLKELAYKVDKYSTEELLVPISVSGEPTSTAIIADINYQITGHNYIDDLFVDMGLPSGTLWAKCDIDITKSNGFCDTPFTYEKTFFSWGNTDGHNPTSTSSFSPYDWGSANAQEPYYDGQVYGGTKGNTLQVDIPLSKEYDAAMANLGQLFKMPSSTQFQELIDNCVFIDANGDEVPSTTADKRVTVNEVVGIYLKSNANGNRLFFSASGVGVGSSWDSRGAGGSYWSASFNSARNARGLYFNSGIVYSQNSGIRSRGFAVRPIKNQQ